MSFLLAVEGLFFIHCIGGDNYKIEKPFIYIASKNLIMSVTVNHTPGDVTI